MNSRRKGKAGENELVRLLKDELGDATIRRNLDQTRDGGCDILGVGPFRIEVKRCEKPRWGAWRKQAIEQAGDGIAVIAWRANGKPWEFDFVGLDKYLAMELFREAL